MANGSGTACGGCTARGGGAMAFAAGQRLSSINQVARVLTPENAAEVLPQSFGKSAREAEFVAASVRPVEHPPRRDFLVTPVRATPKFEAPGEVTARAFYTHKVTSAAAAPSAGTVQGAAAATPDRHSVLPDRPRIKPLDADRARVCMTVSRRLLDKLAAARDALSHSHPRASEETICSSPPPPSGDAGS